MCFTRPRAAQQGGRGRPPSIPCAYARIRGKGSALPEPGFCGKLPPWRLQSQRSTRGGGEFFRPHSSPVMSWPKSARVRKPSHSGSSGRSMFLWQKLSDEEGSRCSTPRPWHPSVSQQPFARNGTRDESVLGFVRTGRSRPKSRGPQGASEGIGFHPASCFSRGLFDTHRWALGLSVPTR